VPRLLGVLARGAEDFNYAGLILATLGLAVGSYVTGWLADMKEVKRAWK
jgi:hypothetical protein